MRTIPLASLLAPALFAGACTSTPSDPYLVKSDLARDTAPAVPAADLEALVADNTAFAIDLYHQVRGEPGNLFMSPHSISTALAMTYAGAAGSTADEMAATLHFTLPEERLHAAFNALDLALASRAEAASGDTIPFRLRTANSIWGREGATFLDPFLDTLAVNYGAGLRVLDFAADPDGARGIINGWVEDQTNDKIRDLLPAGSIRAETRLVLTNAIYFSAAWATPFEASDTRDATFHTASGPVQTPTLHGLPDAGYAEGDGWRAVELPYDGGQLGMTIIVPDDLAAFEASLDDAALAAVTSALTPHVVTLALPKFEFDAPLSLGEALQTLGMPTAFTADADFSRIDGTRSLAISDVLHKGFVAIDEEGTEAAAATAVILEDTLLPDQAALAVDR
ncbi:MAG: serpin family protein, partial [Kofleriaceae bacterium]